MFGHLTFIRAIVEIGYTAEHRRRGPPFVFRFSEILVTIIAPWSWIFEKLPQ